LASTVIGALLLMMRTEDVASCLYGREAAMYVQASRLKIAARVSMSPRFELPAAKEIWQPFV
jgi:hypothetical protein